MGCQVLGDRVRYELNDHAVLVALVLFAMYDVLIGYLICGFERGVVAGAGRDWAIGRRVDVRRGVAFGAFDAFRHAR